MPYQDMIKKLQALQAAEKARQGLADLGLQKVQARGTDSINPLGSPLMRPAPDAPPPAPGMPPLGAPPAPILAPNLSATAGAATGSRLGGLVGSIGDISGSGAKLGAALGGMAPSMNDVEPQPEDDDEMLKRKASFQNLGNIINK